MHGRGPVILFSYISCLFTGLPKLRGQQFYHRGPYMQELRQLTYPEAVVPFPALTHSPNQYILRRMLHINKFQNLGPVSSVFQDLGSDGICVKAVSYTHLDVYKRQPVH